MGKIGYEPKDPISYGNLKERLKTGAALIGGTAAIDGLKQIYHSITNSDAIENAAEQVSQIPGVDYVAENAGELGLEFAATAAIMGYISQAKTLSGAFLPNSEHAFDHEREHLMRRLEAIAAMAVGIGTWAVANSDKIQDFIDFYSDIISKYI